MTRTSYINIFLNRILEVRIITIQIAIYLNKVIKINIWHCLSLYEEFHFKYRQLFSFLRYIIGIKLLDKREFHINIKLTLVQHIRSLFHELILIYAKQSFSWFRPRSNAPVFEAPNIILIHTHTIICNEIWCSPSP